MGRKSHTLHEVFQRPPRGMDKQIAKHWRELVAAYPFDYFNAGDRPLLKAWAVLSADLDVAIDARDADACDRLSRSLSSLAIRMRIAPSTRIDPRSAGSASRRAQDNPAAPDVEVAWRDRVNPDVPN